MRRGWAPRSGLVTGGERRVCAESGTYQASYAGDVAERERVGEVAMEWAQAPCAPLALARCRRGLWWWRPAISTFRWSVAMVNLACCGKRGGTGARSRALRFVVVVKERESRGVSVSDVAAPV